jgi:DNA-binding transcriptional MerR regulator
MIGIQEAATLLGVTAKNLRQWEKEGKISLSATKVDTIDTCLLI